MARNPLPHRVTFPQLPGEPAKQKHRDNKRDPGKGSPVPMEGGLVRGHVGCPKMIDDLVKGEERAAQ